MVKDARIERKKKNSSDWGEDWIFSCERFQLNLKFRLFKANFNPQKNYEKIIQFGVLSCFIFFI